MSESSPVGKQPMPTATRVAVILLALLGVLLLADAALRWATQELLIDRMVETGYDADSAAQSLLLFMIAFAVMGLSALLSAAFLPRRRTWARQVGIMVTSLLVFLTLVSAVTVGGVTVTSLLVLVAAIAGMTSLLSRQTRDWVTGVVRTD